MQYNELQTPRVENFARRLLGIRNGGIVPTAAPELGVELAMPSLEDVLPLAGYVPFGAVMAQAAVAGQYSFVALANLTQAQLFGVRASVNPTATMGIWLSLGPTPGGGLIAADQVMWRDTRRSRASIPLSAGGLQVSAGPTANVPPSIGAGLNAAAYQVTGLSSMVAFPWVVLAPGTAVVVIGGNVNVGITASFECWLRDCIADELVV